MSAVVSPDGQRCNSAAGAIDHESYTAPVAASMPVDLLADQIARWDSPAPPDADGVGVAIGIDAEWVRDQGSLSNRVLSWQFYLVTELGELPGIIFASGPEPGDRISFVHLVKTAIRRGFAAGKIIQMPARIQVFGHFLRADLTTFKDFWADIAPQVRTVGKALASDVRVAHRAVHAQREEEGDGWYSGERLILRDPSGKALATSVRFYDTYPLMPQQNRSLAEAGQLLGIEKLSLPPGHDKSRMDRLLENHPEAFEAYAIRDAEIAVKYGIKIGHFAREELGLKNLPTTLPGLAVQVFAQSLKRNDLDRDRIFGVERVRTTYWSDGRQKPASKMRFVQSAARRLFENPAGDSYLGGRNECMAFGPTEVGAFIDYDIKAAYVTALRGIRELDYGAGRLETDPEAYRGDVCGFARVAFEFPKYVRYPSLPVRTEAFGLIYPLEGISWCTAPEIDVALRLGATIRILQGVVIPWVPNGRFVFEPFVDLIKSKRSGCHPKSMEDQLWKEIGNSLYGKLAQGVKEKRVFDSATGRGQRLPPSSITNPYFASHTTGVIRAMVSEIIGALPSYRRALSVTTDGFLSDAQPSEIDLSGPICSRFRELGAATDSQAPILERKHGAAQLILARTRGQFTAQPLDGHDLVLARTSVRPPDGTRAQQNAFMVDLYLGRTPGQKLDQSYLISPREMWIKQSDLVEIDRQRSLNLEFDFKRRPINPRVAEVCGVEHLAMDTAPWPSVEDAIKARVLFDGWRRQRTLKTVADWDDWEEYWAARAVRKSGINVMAGGAVDVLRRLYLRAYSRGAWGIEPKRSYAETAAWLTASGYPTSADELKNAKRARLPEGIVPVTRRVIALLRILLQDQPSIDLARFFGAEAADALAKDLTADADLPTSAPVSTPARADNVA